VPEGSAAEGITDGIAKGIAEGITEGIAEGMTGGAQGGDAPGIEAQVGIPAFSEILRLDSRETTPSLESSFGG
jgi:hypothetical protein